MLILRFIALFQPEDGKITLDGLPAGNGSLPDLLQIAGIQSIELAEHLDYPTPMRWEGHGVARIEVHSYHDRKQFYHHHGLLPCKGQGWVSSDNEGLYLMNVARLEDAQSVIDCSSGADWNQILQAVGLTEPSALSPIIRVPEIGADNNQLQVWNPLPIKRHCPVSLPKPSGTPPWGLKDQHGNHFPVQITEGAFGPEMLSMIPLGPLECVSLETHDTPVSGSYWEINEKVLDNGLLRAELDDRGNIKRLCLNGKFVDLGGVLCQAMVNGFPLDGPCNIQILESGPVRAQISVNIESSLGLFRMSYELYAHEDFIRVSAFWSNKEQALVIDHATSYRRAPLSCAGEMAPWCVEQAANAFVSHPSIQHACHWARLGEYSSQRGFSVASEWPMDISAHAGHLRVHVKQSARYAIMGGSSKALGNPGRVVQHCTLPGRALGEQPVSPPAFFLSNADDLVPLWIRHAGDNFIEMLLSEQTGQRGKAFLLPVKHGLAQAERIDVNGNSLRPLNVTKEEDGFEIDYQPYEVFLIRWQFC